MILMTDIDLQNELVKRVKECLKSFTLSNNGEQPVHVNVYPQELPAKANIKDDKHFPYVLVCLDETEIRSEEEWIQSVYFSICIKDNNPNKQGHVDVANIMNRIVHVLMEERVIALKYRLKFPLLKQIPAQQKHPFYSGGIVTLWDMPNVMQL